MDAKEKGVPGELKMSPEMVKVVCDKAHENGYLVAAHVESPQGVRVALENGVDSIEHGAKIDDDTIKLFKERKAFLCTTISPALPYALFDRSITNATEVEQFNGNVVFEGIIACAKAALENDIPVVLAMMSDVRGLHSMISGENCIISTNIRAFPMRLHCIRQPQELPKWRESVILPVRSKKINVQI